MSNKVFSSRVAGIPCVVSVSTYRKVKGSYSMQAESDWDYYGYEDIEFEILDRRGRPAEWLERKMSPDDKIRIEEHIRSLH